MNAKQFLKELAVQTAPGSWGQDFLNMVASATNDSAWLSGDQQGILCLIMNDIITSGFDTNLGVNNRKNILSVAQYINSCHQ
jgi:hypothetical protein